MSTASVARSYLESFATGDPDSVAAHVTDDFVNEHTAALSTGCEGRDEYRRRLPGFLASFAGLRYDIEDVVTEDDRAAAAYTMRARYEDHDIVVRGVMRIVVRDGLVAHRIDYYDALGFLQQIGQA
jgi:ketosteroid isomerase-like protein